MEEDLETLESILPIFKSLKKTFLEINDVNFYLCKNYNSWEHFVFKFYKISKSEEYKYLFSKVLGNSNFCINFNKFMVMDISDIKLKIKEIKVFYRNKYILFLLQMRERL